MNQNQSPAAIPDVALRCLEDVISHYFDFKGALENEADKFSEDDPEATYTKHQLRTLERMKNQAEMAIKQASLSPSELDSCWKAANDFAVSIEEGEKFQKFWANADFDSIRKYWPDAPAEIFLVAPESFQMQTSLRPKP